MPEPIESSTVCEERPVELLAPTPQVVRPTGTAKIVSRKLERPTHTAKIVPRKLGELCEAVATPVPAAAAAPTSQADLSPFLDQLNATLAGLANASPHSTQIVQTLGGGVHDVLAQLATVVGDHLMPAVQGLSRRLKKAEGKADRGLTQHLDRTLKSLDMMQDLVASLRKIDMSELAVKAVDP